MAAGEERVGRDRRRVAVEVVVDDVRRVAHRARVAEVVVVEVAAGDLLVQAPLGVERGVARVRRVRRRVIVGLRRAARVHGGVAVADAVAVLGQAVVGGEHQRPVLARVIELDPVEQVAVGLEHVDVVLVRVADGDVSQHEAVGAVGLQGDVLLRADAARAAVARRGVAGVDHGRVGIRDGPLDLEVAANAGTEVGMPWRSICGGGGAPLPGLRPSTLISAWSFGQWYW